MDSKRASRLIILQKQMAAGPTTQAPVFDRNLARKSTGRQIREDG